MRIPKKLKQLYENDKNRIKEKNKEFHDSFIEEHYGNAPVKRRASFKLVTALSCIAVLLVAVTLLAVLWKPAEDIFDTPEYFADSESVRSSSIEEFTTTLPTITFDFTGYDIATVTCIYDRPSTDELYYNLMMENFNTLEFVDLKVSINKYYHFQKLWTTPTEYNTASVKSKYLIDASGETIYASLMIGDVETYLTYTVFDSDLVTMYEAFIDRINV